MDELKEDMKHEKAKNAEMLETISRRNELDEGNIMKLEGELHVLRSHTEQNELHVSQGIEKLDTRVNDLNTEVRKLNSSSRSVSDVQEQLKEFRASLDGLKSSTCPLDKHDLLKKHHEALKKESQTTNDDMRTLRVKVDTLSSKIHSRFQKLENALAGKGVEGMIELEDTGPPEDIMDDVMLLKSEVKTLQDSMRRLDALEEQVENEGTTMEQALKQLDQLTDKFPHVDKRLMAHERRIEDLVRDFDAQKTLMGLRSMKAELESSAPGEGAGEDPRAAAALELALELKHSLHDVKTDQGSLQQLTQKMESEIRNLKAALMQKRSSIVALEGPVDHVRAEASGVDSTALSSISKSIDHLWEVIRDLGERARAANLASNGQDSDLGWALYGHFQSPEELAVSASQTVTLLVSTPTLGCYMTLHVSATCTFPYYTNRMSQSRADTFQPHVTSVNRTIHPLRPPLSSRSFCSHRSRKRPLPRKMERGGGQDPQEEARRGLAHHSGRRFGAPKNRCANGHLALVCRRHGLAGVSPLQSKPPHRSWKRRVFVGNSRLLS